MLLAPNSSPAIRDDLCCEDAFDSTRNTLRRPSMRFARNESEISFAGCNVAQQLQDLHHRVVIVGNRVMIPALQRPHLRPASIWVLRHKNVVESPQERLAISFS